MYHSTRLLIMSAMSLVISLGWCSFRILVVVSEYHQHQHTRVQGNHSWYQQVTKRLRQGNKPKTIRLQVQRAFNRTKNRMTTTTDSSLYSFRIVQLADLHLGENAWTEWGPRNDHKTAQAIHRILSNHEPKPDLLVLSGDQITANNIDRNASAYYKWLAETVLSPHGIPWAMIFGNHDDAPMEEHDLTMDNNQRRQGKTSRTQLAQTDQQYDLSLTQIGPGHVFGTSNYVLNIYHDHKNPQQAHEIAARIVLLDSGGGSLPQQIHSSQLTWLHQIQQHRRRGHPAPTIVFSHIPTRQFRQSSTTSHCLGMHKDGVSFLDRDAGLVDTLANDPNVLLLAVGHNHGNDYCCHYQQQPTRTKNTTHYTTIMVDHNQQKGPSDLHLCFGRHSGYGGYGTWDRGARVYDLHWDFDTGNFVSWSSHVRMENGSIVDEYTPSRTNNTSYE